MLLFNEVVSKTSPPVKTEWGVFYLHPIHRERAFHSPLRRNKRNILVSYYLRQLTPAQRIYNAMYA